jgi:hypothetical protein
MLSSRHGDPSTTTTIHVFSPLLSRIFRRPWPLSRTLRRVRRITGRGSTRSDSSTTLHIDQHLCHHHHHREFYFYNIFFIFPLKKVAQLEPGFVFSSFSSVTSSERVDIPAVGFHDRFRICLKINRTCFC